MAHRESIRRCTRLVLGRNATHCQQALKQSSPSKPLKTVVAAAMAAQKRHASTKAPKHALAQSLMALQRNRITRAKCSAATLATGVAMEEPLLTNTFSDTYAQSLRALQSNRLSRDAISESALEVTATHELFPGTM